MRRRSIARPRPGSWLRHWLCLALIAVPLSGTASAQQAAPPADAEAPAEVPADAPDDAPAPDTAPAEAPAPPDAPDTAPAEAPAPDTAGSPGGLHVVLLDVPPAPEQAQAAALLVPAARAAIATDPRFVLAADEQVAAARAEHGVGGADLSYPDACRVGRAVGASHAILLGGYELTVFSKENKSELKRAIGMVAEQPPGHGSAHTEPAARHEFEARATASVMVMDMASCEVGEQAVIRARRESDMSVDDARAKLRGDFAEAVRQAMQKLFPLRVFVRAPSDHGGIISHGARHGVRPGQYYDVQRAGRVVGHVHVDEVAPDSAEVSLVRGVQRLQAGDRLIERDAVRVWEVGLASTPNVLSRREADDVLGVGASAHLTVSSPVSGNVYGLMVEYLLANDLTRWRAGVHYAWQLRLLPRRLFAHARIGMGVFWANQPLLDETGQMYDGGTTRGIELLNGVGVKALLGPSVAVQAEVGVPLLLGSDKWRLDSNPKLPAPAEALIYTRAHRALPVLTLGVSWRF